MKRTIAAIIISAVLFSCAGKDAGTAAEGHPAAAHEDGHSTEESNIVTLTEEQVATAGITMGSIEMKNLQTSIRASGTLSVPNQNKALITSVNSGVLKTLLIHPGSFVKKGQAVATIVNPGAVRLQQDLQTTNAQINLAETELKRQRELVEGNAAPLKNVQRVETELTTLKVTRNALEKELSAMGISTASVSKGNIITVITITTPISGTVSNVTAQIGSPVSAATPIAEIVNNSQLHLDLFVYEKDLPRLHTGQVIHFTLTNNPGKEYDARIFSIGTAFANETKSIPIHAVVLGDKSGLIEGMNITALVSIGQKVVPAVPADAIVNQQGQDFIFAASQAEDAHAPGDKSNAKADSAAGEKPVKAFEKIPVMKGVTDVGYTEITLLKEITPGTAVVTKGAFFLLAKMSNAGGHEH